MLQNQSKPSPPTQAYHAPDLQVRSSTLLSGGLQLPLWFPAHTHRRTHTAGRTQTALPFVSHCYETCNCTSAEGSLGSTSV